MRRFVVDLKAEHPPLNDDEIATICYVRFGRRPDYRTVRRVLSEEPMPLRMVRRYPPYHEMPRAAERRMAVVRLHAEGWNVKIIASYLKTTRSTVYRALKRWIEDGVEGLDDRPNTGGGVRKADLKAYAAVRRLQENPNLGEFRVHAALAQIGIHLSPRNCGRILVVNRRLYGLEKPKAPTKEKREMPFRAARRHQYWTADVRYIDDHRLGEDTIYVISILENHSRAVLASSLSRSQDLGAFLRVLHRAVEEHGSPEALVTDGGGIFRAKRAKAVYEALGIRKEEIERRRSWLILHRDQLQRPEADGRLAFRQGETWAELVAAHSRWVEDFNAQVHWAHRYRADGRRSPKEVLSWVPGAHYGKEDLDRAFFSTRFLRVLDASGYATWRRWRVYGEEGLAGRDAALWLREKTLTIQHAGEPLSHYEVEFLPGTEKLRALARPVLFEITSPFPNRGSSGSNPSESPGG